MYKLTDTFVRILLIFAFLSVAFITLNKLFAVIVYIIKDREYDLSNVQQAVI